MTLTMNCGASSRIRGLAACLGFCLGLACAALLAPGARAAETPAGTAKPAPAAVPAPAARQKTFKTPEEACEALVPRRREV